MVRFGARPEGVGVLTRMGKTPLTEDMLIRGVNPIRAAEDIAEKAGEFPPFQPYS